VQFFFFLFLLLLLLLLHPPASAVSENRASARSSELTSVVGVRP
jgi:hypothetical protein